MSSILSKLVEKHDDWIDIVKSLAGRDYDYAEDVVQDAYIRIHKYIEKGRDLSYGEDGVNTFYFYLTLKSVFFGDMRESSVENKDERVHLTDNILMEFVDNVDNPDFECKYSDELIKEVFLEISSWDWYDRNVFIAYFTTDNSMRKMAKETGIGLHSLYAYIKRGREIILDKFKNETKNK